MYKTAVFMLVHNPQECDVAINTVCELLFLL